MLSNYVFYLTPQPTPALVGKPLGLRMHRVRPNSPYPPGRHPLDHLFTWQRGRVLNVSINILTFPTNGGRVEAAA